jgi:hypothetical protein
VPYSIRLSAHFHAEHLLDRDHYLDWLVSSLESSPQSKLPMWLLVTQIYWKDILKSRKFGRRLSAALLNQWAEVGCSLLYLLFVLTYLQDSGPSRQRHIGSTLQPINGVIEAAHDLQSGRLYIIKELDRP